MAEQVSQGKAPVFNKCDRVERLGRVLKNESESKESRAPMNKYSKAFSILTLTILLLSACRTWTVQTSRTEPLAPKPVSYQTVLGKSVSDAVVADFITNNNCSNTGQFQVCRELGMALWIDASQIVETIWLYSGNEEGFGHYRGELPFGLSFYDPMWRVEEKLSAVDAEESPQPSSDFGLPDEGSTPDHFHYWAVYKRFDMIVIYNCPFADEDAYIYAVLVNS